eukprot:9501229-Pyramimonas_sp.AAC.1
MKLLCAVCEGRPAATVCFAEEALMCEECDGRCVEFGLHPHVSRVGHFTSSASFLACSLSQTVESVPFSPLARMHTYRSMAAPVGNSPTREPFSGNDYALFDIAGGRGAVRQPSAVCSLPQDEFIAGKRAFLLCSSGLRNWQHYLSISLKSFFKCDAFRPVTPFDTSTTANLHKG